MKIQVQISWVGQSTMYDPSLDLSQWYPLRTILVRSYVLVGTEIKICHVIPKQGVTLSHSLFGHIWTHSGRSTKCLQICYPRQISRCQFTNRHWTTSLTQYFYMFRVESILADTSRGRALQSTKTHISFERGRKAAKLVWYIPEFLSGTEFLPTTESTTPKRDRVENLWIENVPPPLEVFLKFIRFSSLTRPLLSSPGDFSEES